LEKRTVIGITHRLPRLPPGTRVLVMDCGQIAESGPHHKLITRQGPYRQLLHAQQAADGEPG
jgi:ABC-type multidrug transport system fused ATPase/permease subunit